MTPESSLMLELLTTIWTELKGASERFEFDYDGAAFDVSVLPERARPGVWRCRITHDAHRHRIVKATGKTRYFTQQSGIVDRVRKWAHGLADEHGRLHQRERAIAPYCQTSREVPAWAMTAPEIMISIANWDGTSMLAMHAGNPTAIAERTRVMSVRDMSRDGDRYVSGEIVVRHGRAERRAYSIEVLHNHTVMTLIEGVSNLPETMIQGLPGRLIHEIVAHPSLESALATRILSAAREGDLIKLTLSSEHRPIETPPDGVDMGWMRVNG